jgi:hypothetical protein
MNINQSDWNDSLIVICISVYCKALTGALKSAANPFYVREVIKHNH